MSDKANKNRQRSVLVRPPRPPQLHQPASVDDEQDDEHNMNASSLVEVVRPEAEVVQLETEVVQADKEVVLTEKEEVQSETEVVLSDKEVVLTETEVVLPDKEVDHGAKEEEMLAVMKQQQQQKPSNRGKESVLSIAARKRVDLKCVVIEGHLHMEVKKGLSRSWAIRYESR